jgi:hypothetical protein
MTNEIRRLFAARRSRGGFPVAVSWSVMMRRCGDGVLIVLDTRGHERSPLPGLVRARSIDRRTRPRSGDALA